MPTNSDSTAGRSTATITGLLDMQEICLAWAACIFTSITASPPIQITLTISAALPVCPSKRKTAISTKWKGPLRPISGTSINIKDIPLKIYPISALRKSSVLCVDFLVFHTQLESFHFLRDHIMLFLWKYLLEALLDIFGRYCTRFVYELAEHYYVSVCQVPHV